MFKKHSQIFQTLLFISDMTIVSISWVSAYYLRFISGPVPVFKGTPRIEEFLYLLLFLLPIYALVFRRLGLYEPMRARARVFELKKILNASFLATLIFITILYLIKEDRYSRGVFAYFLLLNILLLSVLRWLIRSVLAWFRRKGYNLRHILIVGDGVLAQQVADKIKEHAEYGFKVAGFISKESSCVGSRIKNVKVVGTYGQIKGILKESSIDQVVIAMPFEHIRLLKVILNDIYDELVEIKIVPDFYQYFTIRKGIDDLDGLPVISLRESPIYGWNKVFKRAFDIIVSMLILVALSPFMLLIALLIKLSSPGPIIYKQKRMGLDGKTFKIAKFRTMVANAEGSTGPVWAKKKDSRRTRIGAMLRRFNLDELPQFVNVLKGQMSIVGPRPERPEFMKDFKDRIPEYMLRHKMKAGITGWAQVNGLRGDTSLEERTKYDLYYIEHWSLWFDIKIFIRSFIAVKNAS